MDIDMGSKSIQHNNQDGQIKIKVHIRRQIYVHGIVDGGPQYCVSILRNAHVACPCLSMSPVVS